MNFVAWSSLAAVPPLVAISLVVEPAGALWRPVTSSSWMLWGNLCVLAYAVAAVFYALASLTLREDLKTG